MLERDPCVIAIEFVAEDHRQRGVDSLAHLHLRHDQRRVAGMVDANEGIGRELSGGVVGWLLRLVDRSGPDWKMKGENKSAGQSAFDQRAA